MTAWVLVSSRLRSVAEARSGRGGRSGLSDLPSDHVDVDILIGEPVWMGRGVGPTALQLVLDRLRAEGVSSVGVGIELANCRALRAFDKAGFRLRRRFDEGGRAMCYLTREAASAV